MRTRNKGKSKGELDSTGRSSESEDMVVLLHKVITQYVKYALFLWLPNQSKIITMFEIMLHKSGRTILGLKVKTQKLQMGSPFTLEKAIN